MKWQHFYPADARSNAPPELKEQLALSTSVVYTAGKTIQQSVIKQHLIRAKDRFNIQGMAFDPWQSNALMEYFSNYVEVAKVPQNTTNYKPAMLTIEDRFLSNGIVVDTDSLARWCMSNVVSDAEMLYPKKLHEDLKIDAAVTLIMAGLYVQKAELEEDSEGQTFIAFA